MAEEIDFISHYLKSCEGTMVPPRFNLWCAISLLATASGKRLFVDQQHYLLRPCFYMTLVGEQGSRKTTAKDHAQDIFTRALPDYPLGSSVQSREDIIKQLASDETLQLYTDHNGLVHEWHPMMFFVNELKNFMSIHPEKMVEFLTDIYERNNFSQSTIKHGKQAIKEPCINILACENPDWIVTNLRLKVTSGGFSRRMLYINEVEHMPRVTFPKKDEDAFKAEDWCIKHLKDLQSLKGQFKWDDDAAAWFDVWFKGLPHPENKVLAGLYEAKDGLATKVAMCLALAQPEPKLVLDVPLVQRAVAILESIEENLPRLTAAAGRNELAVSYHKVLQWLNDAGGCMPEKKWHCLCGQELNEIEYKWTKQFLMGTDQLFEKLVEISPGKLQNMVFNQASWRNYMDAETQKQLENPVKYLEDEKRKYQLLLR